jgi:hypothetical protein
VLGATRARRRSVPAQLAPGRLPTPRPSRAHPLQMTYAPRAARGAGQPAFPAPRSAGPARRCGLLSDDRVFPRELGLELCDPIVSPVALHDPPMMRAAGRWKVPSNLWSEMDHLRRLPAGHLPDSRRQGLNGYLFHGKPAHPHEPIADHQLGRSERPAKGPGSPHCCGEHRCAFQLT